METFESAAAAWLLTRPAIIQEAARRWPINALVIHDGETLRVFGWNETADSKRTGDVCDLMLILTPGDPHADYDDAYRRKVYACARHFVPVAAESSHAPCGFQTPPAKYVP